MLVCRGDLWMVARPPTRHQSVLLLCSRGHGEWVNPSLPCMFSCAEGQSPAPVLLEDWRSTLREKMGSRLTKAQVIHI